MRIYNVKSVATAAILLCGISVQGQAETLGQIYQQALENDHQFKAAEAAYQAGLENKAIGRANLLPNISGDYTWINTDGDTQGMVSSAEVDRSAESTTSGYSVSLTQPLFNMESWYGYEQGKFGALIAEMTYFSEKQNLIIRTAQAYFDALLAAESLATAKAEENALSHQLEQTQKRFEVGLTAITDVHEAQAAYDSAVANRLVFEGQLGIAFEALEVLTGQPYSVLSSLKKGFPVLPPSPANRQEWVDFAIKNNFDLAVFNLSADQAKARSKQFKARHYPTVTARLGYEDQHIEGDSTAITTGGALATGEDDYDRSGSSVSVSLNVPLFAGGGISANRKKAAYEYVQAQENFYKAQRDTVQNARSIHLTVVTSVATVKARQQAITSNQSAVEATQAGYEVGTRDLVDVLTAQRGLYAAQRDYLDSLYAYVMNTLRLKQVAGLLTGEDLLALDKWLDTQNQVRNTY
ncbi:Outer membrane protein TolC [Thalassocella blandensis]|nr:Outer membrane protein TolC [Thalassocella blandensis]